MKIFEEQLKLYIINVKDNLIRKQKFKANLIN